jgi:hypothetical protein
MGNFMKMCLQEAGCCIITQVCKVRIGPQMVRLTRVCLRSQQLLLCHESGCDVACCRGVFSFRLAVYQQLYIQSLLLHCAAVFRDSPRSYIPSGGFNKSCFLRENLKLFTEISQNSKRDDRKRNLRCEGLNFS